MSYDPSTVSAADLTTLIGRLDRYLNRHGSAYGENPIPESAREDVAQSILTDWIGADWTTVEAEYLWRNGRLIFRPDWTELQCHLRALLFHAGRARVRHWRQPGQSQGRAADHRRRGLDDTRGAGMSSRSADPALIVSAVESASGVLVLSKRAARNRSRRGLPLRFRGGLAAVPAKQAERRRRWFKIRNSTGCTIDVVRRLPDRTDIDVRPYTRFNFERRGSLCNRAGREGTACHPVRMLTDRTDIVFRPGIVRTVKRLSEGFTADDLRDAIS